MIINQINFIMSNVITKCKLCLVITSFIFISIVYMMDYLSINMKIVNCMIKHFEVSAQLCSEFRRFVV